jgi:PKD repeat protein
MTGLSIGRVEYTMVSIKWIPTDVYGDQEIYVVLDPNNLISELNESDNRAYNTAHLLRAPVARLGDDIISFRNTTINFSGEQCYSLESSIINYTWYFGDGDFSYGLFVNHSYTKLGEYNVTLQIVDFRNITDIAHLTVNIINRQPVAQFDSSSDNGFVKTTFYFNSTSYDLDGSIIRHHWNFGDGVTSDEPNTLHHFSSKGEFIVTLTVFDSNSGINKSTKKISIDNLGPRANIEVSSYSAYTFENITFSGLGSYDPDDNISALNFTWQFESDEKDKHYSANVSRAFQTSGNYNISLEVRDPEDAFDLMHVEITILNRAPELNLNVTPNNGTINTKFEFSIMTNDVDGYISNVYIDYGDGSILNKSFNSNPWEDIFQFQHQYSINKNLTVSSYVIDNDGSRSEVKVINLVLRNLKPMINAGPDLRTRVDTDLTITADVNDKDGMVVKCQWDYNGDGVFESVTAKPETMHKYTEPGNYTIILRAWDNDGAWSETNINVTVLPANTQDDHPDSDGDTGLSQAFIIWIIAIVIIILLILLFIFIRSRQKKSSAELDEQEGSDEQEQIETGDQDIEVPPMEEEGTSPIIAPTQASEEDTEE